MFFRRAIVAVSAMLALTSCGGALFRVQTTRSPQVQLAGGRPAHIAVIVMENREYRDIIGSRSAPYINQLAKRYALATQMYATDHPSLPNYLALSGGSTDFIQSDCTGCSVYGSGVAGQLSRARISWKAYMEDLPYPCFKGTSAGGYVKRHDPFVYYRAIAGDPSMCNRVVPLSTLASDERVRRLPTFIWISPNLCHDMHDCDTATGDRFLATLVPPLLQMLGPRGLLFVTWDEGSSSLGCCWVASGGRIATIVAGPGARPGARMNTPINHYSIVQAAEDLLGLRRLGRAGCKCTPTLQPLLAGTSAPGVGVTTTK